MEVILLGEFLTYIYIVKRGCFFNNIVDADILAIVLFLNDVILVGINFFLFFLMSYFDLFFKGFVCVKVVVSCLLVFGLFWLSFIYDICY